MTYLTRDEFDGSFQDQLSTREKALLFETYVNHQAFLASITAMRENANLALVRRCVSAEHFLHCMQLQRDTLVMAHRISGGAVEMNRKIEANVRFLCDRGVHFRGLSDEGGALVVVRR